MPKFGPLLSLIAISAAAQSPTINPNGIVLADTTRPGILAPGVVFSVWGHGYGPKAGCHGPANDVCAVQVLLDGVPIEVQYTNDVLINARMPDAPGAAVSNLVVVSGGLRSDPVEVRRLPETAVIALDGVARVNGPVWIHVELPRSFGVSYPMMGVPWDFACVAFEVRKDGKVFTPMPHPQLGMAYTGPPCPNMNPGGSTQSQPPANRLPLHLQYDFTQPGV